MPFYFVIILSAAHLIIPVSKYQSKEACEAAQKAMSVGMSGSNGELALACIDEPTIKEIYARAKERHDKNNREMPNFKPI